MAFDIIGHCFFLEDGGEMHNTFARNLGVLVKRGTLTKSDARPLVFWITNPNNRFIENVACGGTFGFWFSLPFIPMGPSNDSPFWHFSTNGTVVFIEDYVPMKKGGILWFDEMTSKYPFLQAYKVHYTTHTFRSYEKYMTRVDLWDKDLDIQNQLPDIIILH